MAADPWTIDWQVILANRRVLGVSSEFQQPTSAPGEIPYLPLFEWQFEWQFIYPVAIENEMTLFSDSQWISEKTEMQL